MNTIDQNKRRLNNLYAEAKIINQWSDFKIQLVIMLGLVIVIAMSVYVYDLIKV